MVNLLPNPDQLELVGATRTVLQANEAGIDVDPQETWAALYAPVCALDWLVLSLPSALGGAGFSLTDEFLVFVELGRWLAPVSILWGSVAAEVAALAGEASLAEDIRLGRVRVGLAQSEDVPGARAAALAAGRYRVLREARCEVAVVYAGDEWALVDLEGSPANFSAGVDPSLEVGVQDLTGAPVRARYRDHGGGLHRRAALLNVAMLVGIADATCTQSVEYAKTREQFGHPIGINQVVKHRCADMAVRAAAALALGSYAAVLTEIGDGGAGAKLASARLIAADAAITNASVNIRNHGAVGFTYANRAHWYLRRARVLQATSDGAARNGTTSDSPRPPSA